MKFPPEPSVRNPRTVARSASLALWARERSFDGWVVGKFFKPPNWQTT